MAQLKVVSIPTKLNADGVFELSNEHLKYALGILWFGLNADLDEKARFRPTYRSLFPYFARRQGSGAFQAPTQQSSKQQLWDQQVAISYLLGLDSTISSQFQALRGKEKVVKELGRAVRSGELGYYFWASSRPSYSSSSGFHVRWSNSKRNLMTLILFQNTAC